MVRGGGDKGGTDYLRRKRDTDDPIRLVIARGTRQNRLDFGHDGVHFDPEDATWSE